MLRNKTKSTAANPTLQKSQMLSNPIKSNVSWSNVKSRKQ